MNKIPFTSQNPYAFYAKTIDSYDTETNTREAKKKGKKEQVFSKGDSFPPVFKWETPVLVTYSLDEASKFHHFECLLQCDCAAMQWCPEPSLWASQHTHQEPTPPTPIPENKNKNKIHKQ